MTSSKGGIPESKIMQRLPPVQQPIETPSMCVPSADVLWRLIIPIETAVEAEGSPGSPADRRGLRAVATCALNLRWYVAPQKGFR